MIIRPQLFFIILNYLVDFWIIGDKTPLMVFIEVDKIQSLADSSHHKAYGWCGGQARPAIALLGIAKDVALAREEAGLRCWLAFSARACESVSFALSQSWRLITILNSVTSAELFPQKDKLCYLVPTLPQKDKLLLLFPQKDKQLSSHRRISYAAFLADFKETK
jgi:hypothetical protein